MIVPVAADVLGRRSNSFSKHHDPTILHRLKKSSGLSLRVINSASILQGKLNYTFLILYSATAKMCKYYNCEYIYSTGQKLGNITIFKMFLNEVSCSLRLHLFVTAVIFCKISCNTKHDHMEKTSDHYMIIPALNRLQIDTVLIRSELLNTTGK